MTFVQILHALINPLRLKYKAAQANQGLANSLSARAANSQAARAQRNQKRSEQAHRLTGTRTAVEPLPRARALWLPLGCNGSRVNVHSANQK